MEVLKVLEIAVNVGLVGCAIAWIVVAVDYFKKRR